MKNNSAYYKKRLKPIPKYVLVIVLSIVFFSPFLIMVTTALKTNADAFQLPVRLFPREIIWYNSLMPFLRFHIAPVPGAIQCNSMFHNLLLLALDTGRCNTFYEVPLEEQEEDHDRNYENSRRRHKVRPVNRVLV